MADLAETHAKLKTIRASKTLSLKPTPLLREEIVGQDGALQPFNLRYYQCQGIYHLLVMPRMVLGDDTGTGKCVTADTRVLTNRGLLRIRDLGPEGPLPPETFHSPSAPIQVWTGSTFAPVANFYYDGDRPTRKVTTRSGFVIEGSLRHPVLVRAKDGTEAFKRLADVNEGDFVCLDRSGADFPRQEPSINFNPTVGVTNTREYTFPTHLTPELACLLGYIVAEAWTGSPHTTVITQHVSANPETHADIRALLREVFGWVGNEHAANRDTTINVTSVRIRSFLTACGVHRQTARHKTIPELIFQGTRASVRGFLRGLFEGEASVDPRSGSIDFSTASEVLARDVQVLLLRFGIVSTRHPKRVPGYAHTYWRLLISSDDARRYVEEIGFTSSRKHGALLGALSSKSNPNKDTIPHAKAMVEDLRLQLMHSVSVVGPNRDRLGSGMKQFGTSVVNTFSHIKAGRRNPTYAFLSHILELSRNIKADNQTVSNLVDKHFFYDPVVRVEESSAEVMDLEVDHPDHSFVGNGFVNHNTIQLLGALCYLWDPKKEPHNKALIVTPKSALRQWEKEAARFTKGVRCYVASGTPQERAAIYEAWAKAPTGPEEDKAILLINYAILQRDWDAGAQIPRRPDGKPDPKGTPIPGLLDRITAGVPNLCVALDEAHAFKNTGTKTWQTCAFLSRRAKRVYGLTATLLKNNLIEGFSIYKVIVPSLFTTKNRFMEDYCVTKLQAVPGGRKVPIVVGYKNETKFRAQIDPFFLGRSKYDVSDELPRLITREIPCEMTPAEDAKYKEALSGVLELGDGETRDYSETVALTSLIYTQQVVDSLWLLRYKEGDDVTTGMFADESVKIKDKGSKEEALVDLLTGELDEQKVIVYTRFERLVGRLQKLLSDIGIKSARITGKESDKQRGTAQAAFQDLKSDTRVIFITDAGSQSINLQAASALIFFDAPWSWGDYAQTLGRPIRIGSIHDSVVAYHLVAERPKGKYRNRKTIDHHVLEQLSGKKSLVEKALGKVPEGALDFKQEQNTRKALLRALQQDLRDERLGVSAAVVDVG